MSQPLSQIDDLDGLSKAHTLGSFDSVDLMEEYGEHTVMEEERLSQPHSRGNDIFAAIWPSELESSMQQCQPIECPRLVQIQQLQQEGGVPPLELMEPLPPLQKWEQDRNSPPPASDGTISPPPPPPADAEASAGANGLEQ